MLALIARFAALLMMLPAAAAAEPLPPGFFAQKPNLIVVLVIDQFRADYLLRFQSRFLPAAGAKGDVGGFRYLLANGAYFPYGEYDALQNMTCPGHATILTGAPPYASGIPTNEWFDRVSGQRVYCVEDASAVTVGAPMPKAHLGTSPRNLLATTVGDELKNGGYASRVVSIALKDRAAIMLGGHRADLALWIDQDAMRWVSSTFYRPEKTLPAWVDGLNARLAAQKGQTLVWRAEGPGSGLATAQTFGGRSKFTFDEFGASFPHKVALGETPALVSPAGLTMTIDAAIAALSAEKLGARNVPDVLALSFSSHDYVGHSFGPNSREIEEMTVAEDREIARLLNALRRQVPGGLANVTIVLTADHGIPAHEGYLTKARVPAGRIDEAGLRAALETHLTKAFGDAEGGHWIAHSADLGFSFNPAAVRASKRSDVEVQSAARDFLLRRESGFADVFTATQALAHNAGGRTGAQLARTFVPGRSADVIGIPRPYFLSSEHPVDHMTGYSYDRTVPIVVVGAHVKPGIHATAAKVIDIAPTLTFILGVVPPDLSEGRVLSEIFGARPTLH